MKKALLKLILGSAVFLLMPFEGFSQNIFSGEPVQVVGSFNGYTTTPYSSDYRTTTYRRISTSSGFPNDGRGQWSTTINVQNSGGDVTPINMTGGGGNGFLFISGPSSNRFQNKWVFSGVGSAGLNAINNISAFNSGNDMGLNMSNTGYYTFIFNDVGYTQTNAKFYVGHTANAPVTVANGGVTFSNSQPVISITTGATPSIGENIYVRYRVATNDFTSGTSVVQATGSGTTWTATLPMQTCGSIVYYYIYTSTRTLSQINADSESDRTLSALRYADNSGSNYSFMVSPTPTAGITNNSGTTLLSCEQSSINVLATGGSTYLWDGGTTPNSASNTFSSAGTYNVTVTATNGCTNSTSITITGVVTPQTNWYIDEDGDGYGSNAIAPVLACSNPNPEIYVAINGDCDDNNVLVRPGAIEVCWNNIDDNCDGNMSESCSPVVVNMATVNNTVLPSFAIAVAAYPYAYAGAETIEYRFSIKNNQTNITEEVISSTRFVTIPVNLRNYNISYEIKASAVINGESVPYAGNTITILSPLVPTAKLSSTNCNSILTNLNATISSTAAFGALNYTFRIRLTSDNGETPNYAYTNPSASRFTTTNAFVGFPLQYSTSYSVAVQYTFTDAVTGLLTSSGYGEECTITTPSIPVIGLTNTFCGQTVSRMGETITATPATGALQYEFRIRLTSDNGINPTYYFTAPSTSRFSSLSAFQGISLSYVTQYSISVRYKFLFNSVETWSPFGPECAITTPIFPETEIHPSQCGLTGVALDQTFNIIPYPGFPLYRVTLFEQVGENLISVGSITRNVANFKLNMFTGAQLEKNYTIAVSVQTSGQFRQDGKSCDISTVTSSSSLMRTVEKPFSVVSYPNPFNSGFNLDVSTLDSKSLVTIKIYDMIGRVVEQKELSSVDVQEHSFGFDLPAGVFSVVVSQQSETRTLRVVKR